MMHYRQRQKNTVFTLPVKLLISLMILAVVHRYFADPFLRLADISTNNDILRQWLVGLWGDLWISMLLSLPFFIGGLFWSNEKSFRYGLVGWLLLWTVLTAGHQGYVEFFHQQIIPFHLTYLFDSSFMTANNATLFAPRSLVLWITGFLLCIWCLRTPALRATTRHQTAILFALIITSVLAHVANIRWRVQWFVPEVLQTHYLERLFTNLKTKHVADKTTESDRKLLAAVTHQDPKNPLQALITIPDTSVTTELSALQKEIAAVLAAGKNPVIAVVASESFRPADSGWTRAAEDPVSVTPVLDRLMHNGLTFTQAYSTGPVTRGGQEALWCGTPSATDTSFMRSFPSVRLNCLSDRTAASEMPHKIRTQWIHGGDARFDSQVSFWKHHLVDRFILKNDFPATTSKTGWGISDLAIFKAATTTLLDEQKSHPQTTLMPFILSVTNHIPWALPDDSPKEFLTVTAEHQSYRTTAYFDWALGQFVDDLKQQGLWDRTILVLSSDHGNFEIPRNTNYAKDDPFKWEKLASHINLVLTGGITERLIQQKKLPSTWTTPTSQAQVAPFLAHLAKVNTAGFMDTPLLTDASPWPITCDLNQYLFLAALNKKITKEEVLNGNLDAMDPASKLAVIRHRAFLEMLYEFQP